MGWYESIHTVGEGSIDGQVDAGYEGLTVFEGRILSIRSNVK